MLSSKLSRNKLHSGEEIVIVTAHYKRDKYIHIVTVSQIKLAEQNTATAQNSEATDKKPGSRCKKVDDTCSPA